MYRTPSVKHRFGTFHVALSATPSFENYYASVAVLTPHLRAASWVNACSGFYLSCVDFGLPRISYFAFNSKKASAVISSICSGPLAQVKHSEPLKVVNYVAGYGGSEPEFRRYLCDYTQIGLDLLESDRLQAQRLCATYRLNVQPSGGSARAHLEPSFDRMSTTYKSFSAKHRDALWAGFSINEGPPRTPWDHMLVNQILGCDKSIARPLTNDEISAMLKAAGREFDVPSGWAPA